MKRSRALVSAEALTLALGLVLGLLAPSVSAQQPLQIIAIVEDIEPSPDDEAARGMPLVTQVRAAFVREALGWAPVCRATGAENEPPECVQAGTSADARWSLMRGGKRTGEVATSGWYDTKRMRTVGVMKLASSAPAGERSMEFAGLNGDAVRRPMVALARERAGVPGGWREAPVRREDIAAAVKIFANAIPKLPNCAGEATDKAPALAAEHFRAIGSLVSAGNERVFGIRLDPARLKDCVGAPSVEWSDFWLYAKGRDAPQLLAFGPMRETAMKSALVDFGDWDGDGKIDAIFWHAAQGEDGYVLVWGGFENVVRSTWTYH